MAGEYYPVFALRSATVMQAGFSLGQHYVTNLDSILAQNPRLSRYRKMASSPVSGLSIESLLLGTDQQESFSGSPSLFDHNDDEDEEPTWTPNARNRLIVGLDYGTTFTGEFAQQQQFCAQDSS